MEQAKVVAKLIEHDERLDLMEQRFNSYPTKADFFEAVDKIMSILNSLQQEYVFITHRLGRIDDRLDRIDRRLDRLEAAVHK